jgi:hypothetical protein
MSSPKVARLIGSRRGESSHGRHRATLLRLVMDDGSDNRFGGYRRLTKAHSPASSEAEEMVGTVGCWCDSMVTYFRHLIPC